MVKLSTPSPKYHIILDYETIPIHLLCVVESLRSVVRNDRDIMVWTSSMSLDVGVPISNIDHKHIFSGTPFENFPFGGRFSKQNVANALRLAIVYKNGGMYIDGDFVILSDIGTLQDGLAMQNIGQFNNAIFKFTERRKYIMEALMEEFVTSYDGDRWGYQGPYLFTRVLKKLCTNDAEKLHCGEGIDLTKWDTDLVYPVRYSDAGKMLKKISTLVPDTAIAVHLWNKDMGGMERKILCKDWYKDTWLGMTREKHCPNTLNKMFDTICK